MRLLEFYKTKQPTGLIAVTSGIGFMVKVETSSLLLHIELERYTKNPTLTNGVTFRKVKANFTRCDFSGRFVGHDKSGSESACMNGDPMRSPLQSDKSADSEKSVTTSQIFACRD